MTKWLEKIGKMVAELPAEYRAGTGKDAPAEVKDGETVIGEVPEGLRPLWGLVLYLYDQAQEKLAAHEAAHENGDHDHAGCEEVVGVVNDLVADASNVKDLFFASLRHELGSGNKPLGVRGLQAVTRPERRPRPQVEIVMVGLPPGLPSIFGEPVAEA
ncbi:MAG: hypothetical protein UY99_C0023G0009 [Parcubacteria group bacterium GW2011_GWA1_59_11]|nr:MAG: hypothetical protein UY99_C0023G0009 [Parcubacteria group bacterium GW2011_GWA1_59_11]